MVVRSRVAVVAIAMVAVIASVLGLWAMASGDGAKAASGAVVVLDGSGALTRICVDDAASGQRLCGDVSGSPAAAAVEQLQLGDCAAVRVTRGAAMQIQKFSCDSVD